HVIGEPFGACVVAWRDAHLHGEQVDGAGGHQRRFLDGRVRAGAGGGGPRVRSSAALIFSIASSMRLSGMLTRVGMPPPRPSSSTKLMPDENADASVIMPESRPIPPG